MKYSNKKRGSVITCFFIIVSTFAISACSSEQPPEAVEETPAEIIEEPIAQHYDDFPLPGDIRWGEDAEAVLTKLGYKDASHRWELEGALEKEFFGFTNIGGKLLFNEEQILSGCIYGISKEGMEAPETYMAMKEALTQEYGDPFEEDANEVFLDVRENNGRAGASWKDGNLSINLYENYKTFLGHDSKTVLCEVMTTEDEEEWTFMGYVPGVSLDYVLSSWNETIEGALAERSQLVLFIPDDTIYESVWESEYRFFPYDGGKLREVLCYYKNDINAENVAESFSQVYSEIIGKVGIPAFENQLIGSNEFLMQLQEETDVIVQWDNDPSRMDNTVIILQAEFSVERKDEAKKPRILMSYTTKLNEELREGWLKRISE